MDEVDMENADADDLNELEARLYAQIHHESTNSVQDDVYPTNFHEKAQRVRMVSATSIVNNKMSDSRVPAGRYWSDSSVAAARKNEQRQHGPPGSSFYTKTSESKRSSSKAVPPASPRSNSSSPTPPPPTFTITSVVKGVNTQVENTVEAADNMQSFYPSNSCKNLLIENRDKIDKSRINTRVNPAASGNDPRAKGSTSNSSSTSQRISETKLNRNIKFESRVPKVPNILRSGPFAKRAQKLDHAIKLQVKRNKSKAVRAKSSVQPVQTILLYTSSESDNDDVIEIAVPPPPTIIIADSSEEDCNELEERVNAGECLDKEEATTSFAKPQQSTCIENVDRRQENLSRCTTPCSVLSSDDFIGQTDRTRLLQNADAADDEDLLLLQGDVDSMMEEPTSVNAAQEEEVTARDELAKQSSIEETSFVAPDCSLQSEAMPDHYRVTQSPFRALDVYESESDIQESIYSRELTKNHAQTNEPDSSSGDVVEVQITQKTKRLRKRRASGSNKESETNNDSTNSENDEDGINEADTQCQSRSGVDSTSIAFIAPGEAVERRKPTKPRKDLQSPSLQNTEQMSDNEFLATINTLAQGKEQTPFQRISDDDNDDDSEDEITARTIAEQVLCTTTTSAGEITEEPVSVNNESAAVPDNLVLELDEVFNKIDKLDSKKDPIDLSDNSDEVQLIAPILNPRRQRKGLQNQNERSTEINDRVYYTVYSEGNNFTGGLGWNDEMRKFYNATWNGQQFNVATLLKNMNPMKSVWKIYTEDRFPRSRRRSNQKCINCCEYGHIRAKCPRPRKPPVCYMCGERGHFEPRCPNTMCMRCGNKTHIFTKSCNACSFQNRMICPVCKVRGHTLNFCPDKWRRYHSTTETNAYPNSKVEYKTKKFCCICAGRGHLSENCRSALRFLEYPLSVSDIKSHQKAYNDLAIKSIRHGIGYNLLYNPEEDVSFELAESTNVKQYYGRFLQAVGLGHLLRRKRRTESTNPETTVGTKQRKTNNQSESPGSILKQYVVNPFAKVALSTKKNPVVLVAEVQPVAPQTESPPSTSELMDVEEQNLPLQTDTVQEEPNSDKVTETSTVSEPFKTPNVVQIPSPAGGTSTMDVLEIDSDSNYSFSEHFERGDEQHKSPEQDIQEESREMDVLPDFIPLANCNEDAGSDDQDNDVPLSLSDIENFGISQQFTAGDSDDNNEDNTSTNLLPDIPCEAKIYLTHFHSKFLLSPEGNKFLVEKSNAYKIKARLDWTSIGYILVIFGLKVYQDKFHTELLLMFRSLSDKSNRKQLENSQKVPRRTDVLIRFLRENINQLMSNLGNASELLKRLKILENQHSKSGWKLAEKARRSLNMILIGQAGLRDGNIHLDSLLLNLKKLINDHKGELLAPTKIRDEIDLHWKSIFSSYRYENYNELVDLYNKMPNKNRIPKLNIDPALLGNVMVDLTPTKVQKDKIDNSVTKSSAKPPISQGQPHNRKIPDRENHPQYQKHSQMVPNPMAARNVRLQKLQSQQSQTPNKTPNRAEAKQRKSGSYSAQGNQQKFADASNKQSGHTESNKQSKNQQQQSSFVANKIQEVNQNWKATCDNLLTSIDGQEKLTKDPVSDCKAQSMFWSRESMKYIDDCMAIGRNNVGLMTKLQRVQKKSQSGQLSYNDYRAIIKIHNAMKGKQ